MYCALIGDLIQSRDLPADRRTAVQSRLRQLLDEMNFQFSDCLASPFLLTLGDEFQGLLTAAEPALEIMEYMDRGLSEYQVRLRYGLGLGEISTGPVNRIQALGDDGPAYHYARAGVELVREEGWQGFPVSIQTRQPDESLLRAICQLLNSLTEEWSDAQRQYALDMELLGEQLLVAEKNRVQQSSISRVLKRGRYKLYRETKDILQAYLLNTYDCPESAGKLGRYNRAVALERKRKYEESASILEALLPEIPESDSSQLPDRGSVLSLLSKCWAGQQQYLQAIEDVEAAIQWEERQGAPNQRLAELYAQLGACHLHQLEKTGRNQDSALYFSQIQKARQILETALTLCQDMPALEVKIRNSLAVTYEWNGDYDTVIHSRLELQTFIEQHHMQISAASRRNLYNLSIAYEENKQLDNAMKAAKAAIQVADQLAVPQGTAGRIYLRYAHLLNKTSQCQPEELIPLLEKAVAYSKRCRDPITVKKACSFLEALYRKTGNHEAAAWAAEQSLRTERILRRGAEKGPI